MQYFPTFIQLNQEKCLVIGGGSTAQRKIRLLIKAKANITIVSPSLCSSLQDEIEQKNWAQYIDIQLREFIDSDIHNQRLIIAATNNAEVNARVSSLAKQHNILVNVVDQPDLCSFITPAMVDRDSVQIAISTGGAAPSLARHLRGKIETVIPHNYAKFAAALGSVRDRIRTQFNNESHRLAVWQTLLNSKAEQHYLAGNTQQGKDEIDSIINTYLSHHSQPSKFGLVSLVGAGPGDAELLTLKALRLIQSADIVLYDRLVSEDILDLCRRDAERIYVGKRRNVHPVPQESINQLLIEHAKQGKHVVRLKGGDPFIFGRGGEELEELISADIAFQIVPGITAASGCASYAGIPLTHRDHAQSCLFITGHLKNTPFDLNWKSICVKNQTLVIYMGLVGLQNMCQQLIKHGMSPETPIALIERGTSVKQRVFTGKLTNFYHSIEKKEVQSPTILIVGEVVTLHKKLAWYRSNKDGS